MAWSPFTLVAAGCAAWTVLALLAALAWSRWMRWLRGDFDPPPH